MNIVSDEAFRWFLTLATGVVAGIWCFYDARSLWRSRRNEPSPLLRDKQFGYLMGMVIGAIGVLGSLHFQHVL
jgi:hypothetical protein